MDRCTFTECMAFKGACVNVKYHGRGSDRICIVNNNTIGGDDTLVANTMEKLVDGADVDKTTYHTILRDYERTYAHGNSFAHIYNEDIIPQYTKDADKVGGKDDYIQRKFSLQKVIQPNSAWEANGFVLMTNYKCATDYHDRIKVNNNDVKYNNTFDNCGIFHFQQRITDFELANPYLDSYTDNYSREHGVDVQGNIISYNKDIAEGSTDAKTGLAVTLSLAPFMGIKNTVYKNAVTCDGNTYDVHYFNKDNPDEMNPRNELVPVAKALTDKYSYTLDYFYNGGTAGHHSGSSGVNGISLNGINWGDLGLAGTAGEDTPNTIVGHKFFEITGYEENNKRIAGSAYVYSNVIEHNLSKGNSSGGISLKNLYLTLAKGNTFDSNESSGRGGALLLYRVNRLNLGNYECDGTNINRFTNNVSLYNGGAVAIYGGIDTDDPHVQYKESHLYVFDDLFENNVSLCQGGAVSIEDIKQITLGSTIFKNNAVASGYQNSIILSADQVNAIKVLSEKNDSYLKYRSLNTYAKNNELVGCGGAISISATKVDDNDKDKINDSAKGGWIWILECTFENNEASYLGGAIFAETVGSR